MPDGMNVDPKVIEEITREVKSIGDNHKKLGETMAADLAAVRKLAEDAKGAITPEVKAQIDALSASVLEKQAALEKASGDRLSKLETKLNRGGMGSGDNQDEAKTRAMAKEFHKVAAARRGQLKSGPIADDAVDFAAIQEYSDNFGEYLRRDERAVEHKVLQVGSDPDGGYWVTPAMSARIVGQVWESSPLRSLADVQSISTDALEIPTDFGEFGAGWVGETEARPETTTSQTGVMRINVHEQYAMPKATQKLLEDAAIDVEGWITRKVADKFARVEATSFILGTGVKQPRGILTYPAGSTLPGTIEQVPSTDAAGLKTDGFINTMISLKEPYESGAVWLMRRATVGATMLLKDGDGQYIWRAGLEAGRPSVILGYPVRQAADMPAVAAGTLPVAFGNFREGYTIVDRLGITTLRDPYTAKPFVLFYSRRRVGGDVVNFEAIKLMKVST